MREVLRDYRLPERGLAGDTGLFGPSSEVWRLTRQRVLLLGGQRALLLQIAHPSVAAAVADHSGFERDPWERLWSTLDVVLRVVFGDTSQARAAADSVTDRHRAVTGDRGGKPYSALDPELMAWVHSTLVDSAIATHDALVGRLPRLRKERYYQEMHRFAELFGVPAGALPSELSAFESYFANRVHGLEVTVEARRLSVGILEPPIPLPLIPIRAAQRLLTAGLLPANLRAPFGLYWSQARGRAFRALAASIRGAVPLAPKGLREWPHAGSSERRVAHRSE